MRARYARNIEIKSQKAKMTVSGGFREGIKKPGLGKTINLRGSFKSYSERAFHGFGRVFQAERRLSPLFKSPPEDLLPTIYQGRPPCGKQITSTNPLRAK